MSREEKELLVAFGRATVLLEASSALLERFGEGVVLKRQIDHWLKEYTKPILHKAIFGDETND